MYVHEIQDKTVTVLSYRPSTPCIAPSSLGAGFGDYEQGEPEEFEYLVLDSEGDQIDYTLTAQEEQEVIEGYKERDY